VAEAMQSKAERSYRWGPLTSFGLIVAGLTCALDQAVKFWLLSALHLGGEPRIVVTPFLEFVLTWNTGISYGLFPQTGPIGPWALFAFKIVAVAFLWVWLARVSQRLTALSLGLVIGGALGNAIDRLHWPGVLDFVFFHLDTASFNFRWYVFNLADVAICAGVAGLLYESLRRGGAVKVP
jgi:signal peptidase II